MKRLTNSVETISFNVKCLLGTTGANFWIHRRFKQLCHSIHCKYRVMRFKVLPSQLFYLSFLCSSIGK